MRKLTGILFLFFVMMSFSQAQVNFVAEDGNVDKGDTLNIKVTADNFNGVLSFEYRQSFDTNFFEFIDIVDIHNDLTGFSYVGPMDMAQPQEFIGFSWFEQTGTAVTLPSGSALYTLRFVAIGDEGDMDSIRFIPARNGFEVSDENNDPIPYTLDNGLMKINGGGSGGGEDFEVFLTEASGNKGDQVCLDFSVDNFTNIETMQLAYQWDKDVATYVTTKDFNLKNFSLGSVASPRPGVLRITWEEGTGSSHTLSGKTQIASICFDLTGNGGTSTDVRLEEDGSFKLEVSDSNGDELDIVTDDGKLTILGGGGGADNFTFIAGNAKADKNSNVCVDVSVREFTNVAGMQFTMAWDKNTLTNANIQNTNLKDLDASGNFNIVDGALTCSWDDRDVNGVTVADNTVIFELCFTTSSDCGAKSSVIFNNTDRIDVFDPDLNDIKPVDVENGEVEIECDTGGGDDFELSVKGGSVEEDSEICVDVDVKNFTNIEAMQFSMSWDPSILKYTKVDNINLPGFNSSSYSENPVGKLRVAFSPINPVTFADGTMFQICFEGEDCDKSSDLTFENSPLTIEVTDGNGDDVNVTTANSSINVTCKMTSDISVTVINSRDIRCKDDCNGSISIRVEGVTDHTSEWFKDNETTPFSTGKNGVGNLCSGRYYVIVTDVNDPNNKDTSEVVVLDMPNGPLSVRLVDSVRDDGNCSGELEVVGEGGWGMYSYVWVSSPQPQQRTPRLIDACKGNMHIVNVTDKGNCFVRDTFTVFGPEIEDNAQITELKCNDDCNGAITLNPTGGCPPLTFKWSGTGTDETAQNQDELCAGTYSVTITDTLGDQITRSYTINNPDGITITLDGIVQASGSINVTIDGGTTPYSFVWVDEDDNVVSQQEDLAGVGPGTYTLTVTDDNGCTTSETYIIPEDETDFVSDSSDVSCNGGNDGWIDITVTPDADKVVFEWSHDGSLTGSRADNLTAGTYTVTAKDKNSGSTLWQKVVEITEPDELMITAVNTINCATTEGSRNGSYEVIVTGGTPNYTYEWCNGESTATATSLRGGDDCDILVTDANGCQVFMDDFVICSDSIPDPPTDCYDGRKVISPNDDGRNDELLITCDNEFPNKLFIYDRWGRNVYEQLDYNSTTGIGWNGVDNDGSALNEGGYMWVLRVDLPNGDQRIYRGTVILVR